MAKVPKTEIGEFYAGKTVFVTGVTGFMGKVLVEKLLRSCSDIGKVYVLMRASKTESVSQRLDNLLQAKLFDTIREQNPDQLKKIIAINGDVGSSYLGISDGNKEILERDVSVVFHSAADIRFMGKLSSTIRTNVLGVRNLIELCRKFKNLQALVYASTAYFTFSDQAIEERIYNTELRPQDVLNLLNWADDKLWEAITPNLLGKSPNNYFFSKRMAESLVQEEAGGLPVAIVRPSLVLATWQEPIKGWIEGAFGFAGLIIAMSKGIATVAYADKNVRMNKLPCDTVTNCMIAVAWDTAQRKENLKIYNCVNRQGNLKFGSLTEKCISKAKEHPSRNILAYPSVFLTTNSLLFTMLHFLCHVIPANLLDLVLFCQGKAPRMRKLLANVNKLREVYIPFLTYQWTFKTDNVNELENKMSAMDRKEFNFGLEKLDWESYLMDSHKGMLQHILKEDESDVVIGKQRLRRIVMIRNSLMTLGVSSFAVFTWYLYAGLRDMI